MAETYETEGPKCPCCGRQYTADEDFFFDEMRFTEFECDDYGETFDVGGYTSTSWTCTSRDRPDADTSSEIDPLREAK